MEGELLDISKRILETIIDKGMSYGELSAKTGIPKSALHRYASGATSKIPLDRIKLIANALDVSAAYIMGWDKENEPSKNDSSLSDVKNQVIELVKTLPDEKVQAIYDLLDKLL